ncbi:MAG: 30S ribosomal protein S5, partial [Deltaproteobacteria bacterium]|nr:30S ribosomal protein S5 [Deltaproteobacteria bacterium]
DKTVFINRVVKVVKGGRRFSFSAVVVTGDGMGHVGFGMGKAAEVPEAIRKASETARRCIIKVPIKGDTIPHDVVGKFGASEVVLRPAAPGTGVIAGSTVRTVMDSVGVKDVITKCLGSTNPSNVLQAVISGLLSLREPEAVAAVRGVPVSEMGYGAYD